MKKIIAAFDGLKYAESTSDYAIAIAKQTSTHLVGVFLNDSLYTSYKIYDLVAKDGVSQEALHTLQAKDKVIRAAASANFEETCKQQGQEYTVHHDHNIAIQELKHESIYADLLIINAKETLTHYPEKLPTAFIRDLLTDTQCPVLVVPQKYQPIKNVILLFDGEPSSVHAIKMFTYLLPQFTTLPTQVISVKTPENSLHVPDNKLMKEFMKRHFTKAAFTVLKGRAEEEIVKLLQQQSSNTLVVLGAYRRGTVSRWFKESMADTLMKACKLPLLIAHNK
ncbi:MAG: universal stress protein [Ferruginibacter sp.]|nr:universal stress protein [Ferruginibacter sp.]